MQRKFRSQLDGMKARVPTFVCHHCCEWYFKTKPVRCGVCDSEYLMHFASKIEAKRYGQLRLAQENGEISKLQTQPKYPIKYNGVKIMTVRADFSYYRNDDYIIEDVKPKDAPLARTFKIGQKLVAAFYGYQISVVQM